jgi:hypothetical protein
MPRIRNPRSRERSGNQPTPAHRGRLATAQRGTLRTRTSGSLLLHSRCGRYSFSPPHLIFHVVTPAPHPASPSEDDHRPAGNATRACSVAGRDRPTHATVTRASQPAVSRTTTDFCDFIRDSRHAPEAGSTSLVPAHATHRRQRRKVSLSQTSAVVREGCAPPAAAPSLDHPAIIQSNKIDDYMQLPRGRIGLPPTRPDNPSGPPPLRLA